MPARRNLLIFVGSGLRSDALDDERAWPLATPRMSRVAARGLRVVATAGCPDDPGALACLLTGLHARQHGLLYSGARACVMGNALPTWLRDAGYYVVGVGCVGAVAHQFDHGIVVDAGASPDPGACAYARHAEANGFLDAVMQQRQQRRRHGPFEPDRLLLEPRDDIDGFVASQARRCVTQLPEDRPWALLVVFAGPGCDLPPPPPYCDVVETRYLRDGFAPADLRRLDAFAQPAYPRTKLQRLEPAGVARIRADYLGRVALIDHGVGRIIDAANRRKDRSRLWTVIASDRGHLLGEHGLIGPRSFLAGGVETPFILAGPPDGAPSVCETYDELLSTVDIAATVAALAGADLPVACPGRSLLPLFTGESSEISPARGGVLSEWGDRAMLETERYKAFFSVADAGHCLGVLDLLSDPDEKHILSEDAAGVMLLDSLRVRLAQTVLPLRCPTN